MDQSKISIFDLTVLSTLIYISNFYLFNKDEKLKMTRK